MTDNEWVEVECPFCYVKEDADPFKVHYTVRNNFIAYYCRGCGALDAAGGTFVASWDRIIGTIKRAKLAEKN